MGAALTMGTRISAGRAGGGNICIENRSRYGWLYHFVEEL